MRRFIMVLTIGVFAIGMYLSSIPSDKDAIQLILDTLVKEIPFEGQIHPLGLNQYATKLLSDIDEDVIVYANFDGIEKEYVSGERELKEKVMLVRRHLDQLAVSYSGFSATIEGNTARVELTGRAMGRSPGREDYFMEEHRILLVFKKKSGQWYLFSAVNLDPLEDVSEAYRQ